jgi:hypothetical protein
VREWLDAGCEPQIPVPVLTELAQCRDEPDSLTAMFAECSDAQLFRLVRSAQRRLPLNLSCTARHPHYNYTWSSNTFCIDDAQAAPHVQVSMEVSEDMACALDWSALTRRHMLFPRLVSYACSGSAMLCSAMERSARDAPAAFLREVLHPVLDKQHHLTADQERIIMHVLHVLPPATCAGLVPVLCKVRAAFLCTAQAESEGGCEAGHGRLLDPCLHVAHGLQTTATVVSGARSCILAKLVSLQGSLDPDGAACISQMLSASAAEGSASSVSTGAHSNALCDVVVRMLHADAVAAGTGAVLSAFLQRMPTGLRQRGLLRKVSSIA